jgi:hypothetical protein
VEECSDLVDGISAKLDFDFDFDREELARDALDLLEHELCHRGHLEAAALVGQGDFFARRRSLEEIARELQEERRLEFRSVGSVGESGVAEAVAAIAEEFAKYPTPRLVRHFQVASDAYCLQFALQQTSEIQDVLRKIIGGTQLLVDASVVIPCLMERLLPVEQQQMTNLLRVASAIGCRLVVGPDVLNEVDTHIDRMRYAFRNRTEGVLKRLGEAAAAHFESGLISAYLHGVSKGYFAGSFEDYVSLFKGDADPIQDLIEFLREEMSVEYDEMADEYGGIPASDLAELFDAWKKQKVRRPWQNEEAFEKLVWHDARAFLLVESLRKRDIKNAQYGQRWWWLVRDGNAFRFDKQRRGDGGVRVCMSPAFFARYLSLSPKDSPAARDSSALLSSCLEVSGLGFIPVELRDRAMEVYEGTRELPEYLRRRRLRDLVNRAMAAHDRLEHQSTEDWEASLEGDSASRDARD